MTVINTNVSALVAQDALGVNAKKTFPSDGATVYRKQSQFCKR